MRIKLKQKHLRHHFILKSSIQDVRVNFSFTEFICFAFEIFKPNLINFVFKLYISSLETIQANAYL